MRFTDQHKAMAITLMFGIIVVLMCINFHIKKQNTLIAEIILEMEDEMRNPMEDSEENLEDILRSFDELKTNRAFDANRAFDDFEDEAYQSLMERINSREQASENKPETNADMAENALDKSAYDALNDRLKDINDPDQKNYRSTASYSLVDRELVYLPTPIYLCQYGGKIVVTIHVDQNGDVFDAVFNNASTSDDGCLVEHALEYALQAKFDGNADKTDQIGTITFYFRPKQ